MIVVFIVAAGGGAYNIVAQDIYSAILNESYETVRASLASGVSPNAYNPAGLTPFHAAARQNNVQIIQLLINNGAEVDIQSQTKTDGGQTALHIAAALGNRQAVDRLLRNGADPNIRADDGDTALHNAVINNDLSIVRRLINGGADTELENNSGQMVADMARGPEVSRALKSAFTIVEQRDIGVGLFVSGMVLNILPLVVGVPIIWGASGEEVGAGAGAGVFTQLILGQVGIMALVSIPFFSVGPLVGLVASSVAILTTASIFSFASIDIGISGMQISEAQKAYGAMFATSFGGLVMWITGAILWATGNERMTARGIVLNDRNDAIGIVLNSSQLIVSY